MPESHAACKVAAAVASSTFTKSSPKGAVPKPSCVTRTSVFPNFRVSIGFIIDSLQHSLDEEGSAPLRDTTLQRLKQNRGENDRAGGEALPEDFDAGQVEEIARERNDDHANDGAQNLPLPSVEAGAPDHNGGDD